MGFVVLGQKAPVKIAAYPFQKCGLLAGKVALLSADSVVKRFKAAFQSRVGMTHASFLRACVQIATTGQLARALISR